MNWLFTNSSLSLNNRFLAFLVNLVKNDIIYLNVRKSPDCLDRLYYKDLSLMVGWPERIKKRKKDKGKQFPRCIRTVNCVFRSTGSRTGLSERSWSPGCENSALNVVLAKYSLEQLFGITKFNLVFSPF